jgi:hypothetical protein
MIGRPMENRREQLELMRRHYRVRGYDDGYAGRPAQSTNAEYQTAWRRGRDAKAQAYDG